MEAGQVSVKLGLDSDEFVNALSKAENEFNTLQENLKKSQSNFEKVSKAMAGMKQPTKEMTNLFNEIKTKLKEDQSAVDKFNKKLNELDGGLARTKGAVSSLQGVLGKLAVGGATVAITKKLIDFSKQSVEAFRVQERAIKSLDNALMNTGVYTEQYSKHLKDLSSEIQSYSNYGDEAVEKSIALGQSFAGNIKLTDNLIKSVVDYAAATEQDLSTAFTMVGKSIGTSTNALARYGVKLDDSMSKEEKMRVITETLSQRFSGQAAAMADSSTQLKNAIGDLSEAFGNVLNPAVTKTEGVLIRSARALTDWINKIRIMNSEINSLSLEDVNRRIKENIQIMGTLDSQKSQNSIIVKNRRKEIEADQLALIARGKYLKSLELQKAKESKNLGASGAGDSKSKKSRDKALQEYKKFIEEYKKATNEYEATLEARNYVEATLGIDPLRQQQEYDTALEVYKNYFAKIKEISQSGAKNKAELLKLEESKLAQDLSKIQMEKELETQRKLYDIRKGYADERRDLEIKAIAQERLGGFIGSFQTGYEEKLSLLQWYYKERETITDMHFASLEDKQKAFNDLELTLSVKQAEAEKEVWQQRGQEISSIFGQTFNEILTNQADFSENMQQLVLNLSRYIAKELFQYAFTQFMLLRQAQEGTTSVMAQFAETTNNLSSGLIGIAQSAGITSAATSAMASAQTALQPLVEKTSTQIASAASDYSQAAQSAQKLAASIAQMAVAEAAYSVAKIPFVGGFLAPAAATLTGAAIAASTALVSGASMAGRVLGKVGSSGGGGGNLASGGSSGFSLPKFHSGGLVPGTKEQLAILKGGERVLNPAENALYTSNNEENAQGGGSVVNVWNIKAFDSKDVITTLKENEATLNQITARGIKDNKQGLRTTVQNA